MKTERDERVVEKIDDTLVVWGEHFRLVCGQCWKEAVIPKRKPMKRAKALLRFYDRGWRCTDVTLCPQCVKSFIERK